MEEKLVVAVDVINMKLLSITLMVLVSLLGFSQVKDNQSTFKKRVLETTEVDFLMSYYEQSGTHASVTGGIGNEKLSDIAPTIILAIPLSDDNILTIDAGISAYSSASSSNLNPFDFDVIIVGVAHTEIIDWVNRVFAENETSHLLAPLKLTLSVSENLKGFEVCL